MSVDIATLGVKVDTTDVDKAGASMDKFADKSKDAEKATDALEKKLKQQDSILSQLQKHYLAIAAAAGATFMTIKNLTAAYMEEESAVLKLAVAMGNAGTYTRANLTALREYASTIQQTTKFGDELTIATMANLQTFGMEIDQLKRATKAAMDLSAAKGIDLLTASELIGKAFVGETATLARYGLIIDEDAAKTQKFEAVLGLIQNRFGGSATAELQTYAGQWQKIANWWGDLGEKVGLALLKTIEGLQFSVGMLGAGFYTVLESILDVYSGIAWVAEKVPVVGDKFKGVGDFIRFQRDAYKGAKEAAIEFASANYDAMVSFDNVEKFADKVYGEGGGSGGATTSGPTKEELDAIKKLAAEHDKARKQFAQNEKKFWNDVVAYRKGVADDYKQVLADQAEFGLTENERALNKIKNNEEANQEAILKMFLSGQIKIGEYMDKSLQNYKNSIEARRQLEQDFAKEKASFYQNLPTFQDEYTKKRLEQIEVERKAELEKYKDIEAANASAERKKADLAKETFENQMGYMSDTIGALSAGMNDIAGIFDEGSKGAQMWEQATKALEMAQKAIALVNAVNAVIVQATAGDVYTAGERMAAMAAAVGALLSMIGVSFGGSGGGSSGSGGGGSTVLGGSEASRSLENSNQLLRDTYSMEYEKLSGLLAEMQSLNTNINDLVASAVRSSTYGERVRRISSGGSSLSSMGNMDYMQRRAVEGPKGGTLMEWGAADSEISRLFNAVFSDMSDSMLEAAKIFGQDMSGAMDQMIFSDISLKLKKNPERLEEQLTAYFSGSADALAGVLFDWAKQYQEVGEGLFETVVRLASDMAIVESSMERINKAFSGDMSAQQIVAISESMIDLAGGLEELSDGMTEYYDKFFTDEEKLKTLYFDLSEQFQGMNMSLPMTRDGFRSLVDGLDVTTESGQEAFVAMMKLSKSADQYYGELEDQDRARMSYELQIAEAQGQNAEALAMQRQMELDSLDAGLRPLQERVWLLQDEADAMERKNDLESSLVDQLNQLTMSDTDYQRLQAQNEYNSTVQEIRELENITGLNFGYLIDIAAEIRDTDTQMLESQKQTEINCAAIADLERAVKAQYNDTTEWQQQARTAEDWIQNILVQFKELGVVLWDYIGHTMTPEQRVFRDIINQIYTRQIMDLRDAIVESQQELIDVWSDAAQRIRDQIYEIQINPDNPDDAVARLALMRQKITDVAGIDAAAYIASFATAQEQAEAMDELASMWGDYLKAAQDVYQRPSTEYQAIYSEVLNQLMALEGIATDYRSQEMIMMDQLTVLTEIRDILDYISFLSEPVYGSETIPGYAEGTGLAGVPYTGLYTLHEDEIVLNRAESQAFRSSMFGGGSQAAAGPVINISVVGTDRPVETARLVRREVEGVLRSDLGRSIIQSTAAGR